MMHEVNIEPVNGQQLQKVLTDDERHRLEALAHSAQRLLENRTIWNINSTACGGGVAEMLQPMIAYAKGLKINVRWLVIDGDGEFFNITKRIHNNLHGHAGDLGPLGEPERRHYEAVLASNADQLKDRVRRGDVVICHDPQTAALLGTLRKHGALPVWRSHIGHDKLNEQTERAWQFLLPYVRNADAYIFTRRAYALPQLEREKVYIIPPSIDPLSPKNQPMDPDTVRAILVKTGVLEGPVDGAEPIFRREDGTIGRVERCADVIHLGRAPSYERPLVVQVSRWDHLKDPVGVMHGFARHFRDDRVSLVLAGPNVSAVADDPEGGKVLDEVFVAWRELPHETRKHVHIVCLPMADREENAAIVNALQRHAAVIIQKSVHEGFGLTVTEAMWKSRPVVATAVGGIVDQIEHEVHGLLLDDPTDLSTFGGLLARVTADSRLAEKLGQAAQKRVQKEFLFARHLVQYLDLLSRLLA